MSGASLTLDTIKGLKVQELKDELKALGLEISGRKADLVARLEEYISTKDAEPEAAGATIEETAEPTTETAAPATVTVETEGVIPPEVANQVIESATAALEDVEKAKAEADEVKIDPVPGLGTAAEGKTETVVTEQVTTVTEDAPGEFTVETKQEESVIPADEKMEETQVKPEAVTEAVAEAVEAAVETAEVTDQPAVVEATVDGQPAPPPADAATVSEATPMDATITEAVTTKPETDSVAAPTATQTNGGTAPDSAQNRLFVGCVPFNFSEDDLRPYFEAVDGLKDVSILRDHNTGLPRGCAFAVYDSQAHADEAIEKLDKKLTLPGTQNLIEVRYARTTNKVLPSAEPNEKNQLFFARAPVQATETDIKTVFAEYGEVTDVAVFMNRAQGISKGCGFVSYKEKASAEAAIAGLNEKRKMPNAYAPLTVKWSDPNLHEKKRKAQDEFSDPNRDNTQIFYARIPNTITEDELKEVFERAGSVKEVVLFKTHQAATINKRCGIVTYNSHEEAQNALETLHETHTFPGMDVAMVLKWVDQDLQKRRKMGPDAMGGPMYGAPAPWGAPYAPPQQAGGEEQPPPGCDRDAIKLFLSTVPRTWDVPEIKKVLEEFGNVIECNLVRDKTTREPRGVAFAWLQHRAQGERAIRDLHNRSFDHGPAGQKAISVSKARPRRVSGPGMGGPGYQAPAPYMQSPGGYQQGGYRPQAAPYQQQYYPQAAPAYDPYAQQAQQAYSYQPQQAAPAYGYQAQQAPTQTYQAPATSTYQQAYNPPASNIYGATATGQTATASYGTAQGYDTTQQTQYSAQPQTYTAQYSAPASTYSAPATGTTPTQTTQTGYNYGAQATDASTQPSAQASQYSYSAQTYSAPPTEGYNYNLPQN